MATCSSCKRPVAVARATCLYCGAPLPPEDLAAALSAAAQATAQADPGRASGGPAGARPAEGFERGLLVLDLADANPDTLARALSLPRYEAGLLARRGGLHLHRVLDPAGAEAEAARLGARGGVAVVVPEAEARVRPRRCLGGEPGAGGLSLRTEEGTCVIRRGDVLLVVRGPIVRAYQPTPRRRRIDSARLEEGYRVHLHLRALPPEPAGWPAGAVPRPVEIDPANFETGFAVTGSARLEIDAWVAEVAGGAPSDDDFRRLPPALGPSEPEARGALSAASSLGLASRAREGGRDEGPVVLDTVEQFRFYSGWRAAVERRR
jgi:hypothetical protein